LPKLFLSDLVDVVLSSGVPKATKVDQIKNRPDYQPQFDFYKALREAIQKMHRTDAPKASLDGVLTLLTDKKKIANYPAAVAGYKKWLGAKKVKLFEAPRSSFDGSNVEVVINPDLGLVINGERHVIKLYFKGDKLSKSRADLIAFAMEQGLRPLLEPDDVIAILDVRRGRLYESPQSTKKLKALLAGELAYIATLWAGLD